MTFGPQPAANTIVFGYPGDDRVGNDDSHPGDEDNNPYDNAVGIGTWGAAVGPAQGTLFSRDPPTIAWRHATGNVGDTIDVRWHFGEFVRLEINGVWYRASGFVDWRFHFAILRGVDAAGNPQWVDNGSLTDATNNGF